MSNSAQRPHYQVEALEPRLLLSADGMGIGSECLQDDTDPFAAAEVIQEEWVGEETESAAADLESTSQDELFANAEVLEDLPLIDDAEQDSEPTDADDLAAAVLSDPSETVAETETILAGDPIDLAAEQTLLETLDSQIEGTPMTETLVMTLNAANGPPSAGTHTHLDGDNVQLTDNELVLEPSDRLSGTGSLSVPVIVAGGTIAPGNSPGIIASGDLTLMEGSTTEIEIASNAGAGVGHDQLQVTGNVELG